MKYLFDHKFKKASGWIFYLTIPIGLFFLFMGNFDEIFRIKVFSLFGSTKLFTTPNTETSGFKWIENGFLDEILTFVIIVSGIINSFSKEKIEDELISKLRMESLVLSLYINYTLLLLSNFLIYDLPYLYVMIFHLFTILLFFNMILKFRLNKHYRS